MERTITWRRRWATRSWRWPCRSCPRCSRAGARPRSPSRRGKSRPRPARREAPAPKSRTTRIGTSFPRHPNLVRGVASPVRREPVSGREDRRERGKIARENRTRTRLDARCSAPVASRRSGTHVLVWTKYADVARARSRVHQLKTKRKRLKYVTGTRRSPIRARHDAARSDPNLEELQV